MDENEVELTDEELKIEKQKIVDGEVDNSDEGDDVKLPSDDAKKYANVYATIEDLKKGISSLKADVPEYMLNGMTDDALEQYYVDLRKDFSSKPKEEAPKEEAKDIPKEEEAKKTVNDPQLWGELDAEFNKSGGITDEQYDKLNKLGIPNAVVDKYLDGLKSSQVAFTNEVYGLAGGEEQYNEIKAWAEENYTQKQLDVIAGGTNEEILFKMKAVKADYNEAMAKNPNGARVYGSSASPSGGYKNQEEYILDVMSPEYRKSAKYKAKVEAKFKSSSFSS
jgi:hypothetical protein